MKKEVSGKYSWDTQKLGSIEKIMSQQMLAVSDLMSRQLELLKKLGTQAPDIRVRIPEMVRDDPQSTSDSKQQTADSRQPETEIRQASSAQWRIFILGQLDGEQSSYQLTSAAIVEGEPDNDRFEQTILKLIRRHDIFRTSFKFADNSLTQRIHGHADFRVIYKDATDERIKEAARIDALVKEIGEPFDLTRAPIFRMIIAKLAPARHVFIFGTHHIVMDGLSFNIFIQDMIRLYEGMSLPPLKKQYKDYADWHRLRLESEEMKQQEAYWLDKFSDDIPVLNLPADYPRPVMRSPEGRIIYFSMSKPETDQIKALARSQKVTLTMLFLAAHNVLLHRLTGQEDIIVGIPVSGRPPGAFQDVLGMFSNTLAMRNTPKTDSSFSEFLRSVKENSLTDYRHQDYPLEMLVDKLDLIRVQRDMSRNALFDTLFIYERADDRVVRIENLKFIPYEVKKETSMFDLTLEIIEQEGELHMSMEYSTALFREETVSRWAGYFQRILRQTAQHPDILLSDIDILSDEEKHLLIEALNPAGVPFPEEKTVVDLFEEQAARTPENIAVIFEDIRLTYRELNERSERIARYLRHVHGIQPEDRVGLLLDRSEQMVVGALGIMKSGGAYVPMDIFYPPDRIRHILQSSGCKVLLTEKKLFETAQSLSDNELPVEDIRDIQSASALSGSAQARVPLNSRNLAYVIYTSGSTGLPKGVMVEHRSLVNVMYAYREAYRLDQYDVRLLQMASMSFDVFSGDILRALINGGQMVICPAETRIDLPRLYDLIAEHRINIFETTPALAIPLTEYLRDNRLGLDFMEVLIVSSDSLQAAHYKKMRDYFGASLRVLNTFGITEVTIDSSYFGDALFDSSLSRLTPIAGQIFQNTYFYVLDSKRNLAPVGVTGELYIGGDGLARGYLNNESLTGERFVPNPFRPGERMYKTGDGARWRWDRNLDFLGRLDNQVQIRGYRVELEEIENRLLQHESVNKAAVLAKDLGNSNTELVAYVEVKGDPQSEPAVYRAYLSEFLPAYMIPAYFVILDEFPLTPNAKVDRRSLPDPDTMAASEAEYTAPRNETEKTIARIWEEVLGREKIGIHDNYFSLGGDSIRGIQIVTRMLRANLKTQIRDIFQYPTVFELSARIDEATAQNTQQMASDEVPLTPGQTQFLEKARNHPEMLRSADWVMLRSKQGIAEDAARSALKKIQEVHQSLRTKFVRAQGHDFIQKQCGEDYPFSFENIDLTGSEDASSVMQSRADEIRTTIDIENGPVMKASLFRLQEEDCLLIAIHPLVCDRISWEILLEDFVLAYEQKISGGSAQEISKTGYLQSVSCEQTPGIQSSAVNFPPSVLEAYHTTAQDILLTALARTVKRRDRENTVPISLMTDSRTYLSNDADPGKTVGFFSYEYVFVLELPDSEDIGYQIKFIKEAIRKIPETDCGKTEILIKPRIGFQTFEVLETSKVFAGIFEIAETKFSDFSMPVSDFRLHAAFINEDVRLNLYYKPDHCQPEEAAEFLANYEEALKMICDHCLSKETGELTPSDLTYSGLSMEDLDGIFSN
jgi:amino acid adenylation domain-containing protein